MKIGKLAKVLGSGTGKAKTGFCQDVIVVGHVSSMFHPSYN